LVDFTDLSACPRTGQTLVGPVTGRSISTTLVIIGANGAGHDAFCLLIARAADIHLPRSGVATFGERLGRVDCPSCGSRVWV